jgi:hypothetical protein
MTPPRWLLATALSALTTIVGCHKTVAPEVEPALKSARAEARNVAAAAAVACAAQFTSGRFTVGATGCATNKLPGEEIVPETPSPAKGSSFEKDPQIVNVQVECMAPVPSHPGQSCGTSLGQLHPTPGPPTNLGPRETAESNCKKSPADCEEVVVPSHYTTEPASVDLRIVKPVVGGPPGATVEVTVSIRKK